MAIHKMNWDNDMEQGLDLRGWMLKDDHGTDLGKIDDLLVDSAAGKVRYAIASVPRRVLLPVGLLDLDEQGRSVKARGYTRELLVTLSEYEEGDLTGTQEQRHYAETVRPEREHPVDDARLVQDYQDEKQARMNVAPVDYEHDRFKHSNEVMARIEERYRAIEARRASRKSERELAFSGTEPTETDFRERERLEGLRTTENVAKPKTTIDIVPLDDRKL